MLPLLRKREGKLLADGCEMARVAISHVFTLEGKKGRKKGGKGRRERNHRQQLKKCHLGGCKIRKDK